jgi:hypothetical protein
MAREHAAGVRRRASGPGAPPELMRRQEQLTAALDAHLDRLHETEQAMTEAMRQDLIGAL